MDSLTPDSPGLTRKQRLDLMADFPGVWYDLGKPHSSRNAAYQVKNRLVAWHPHHLFRTRNTPEGVILSASFPVATQEPTP